MIEHAPRSENTMTYIEAILYCQFLEYGGHRDWRLETKKEYFKAYKQSTLNSSSARLVEWGWYKDRDKDQETQQIERLYVYPVRKVC